MKAKKTNNEKKPHAAKLACGDFQNMAEMMKNYCPDAGDVIDCCSIMRRMMGQDQGAEAKETKETQRRPKGGENG